MESAPRKAFSTFYPYLLYNTRGHFIGFTPYRPQPEGRRTPKATFLTRLKRLLHL